MNNDLISIFLIAIGLSADCFAVALSSGISARNHSWIRILRVALSFGIFQALMPLIGWLIGRTVIDFISGFDHWVAFALLGFVGGKMLWESFRHENEDEEKAADISRGWLLITMSLATSIDALAVGLSFAFLNIQVSLASPIIGIVAMFITIIGFLVGKHAGKLLGERAEALGGLILIVIAFRILLSHLLQ
jgi:manganese efflux pump family protein